MPMILKIVESEGSPVASDNPHSVYADVMSCTFERLDGSAMANLYIRDAVKTAMVQGFTDHEKHVSFNGTAYLMNEQGRTISSFTAYDSGSNRIGGLNQQSSQGSANHNSSGSGIMDLGAQLR